MNYVQALRIGGVDLGNTGRGGAITSMRAVALLGSTSTPLARAMTRARVKRRVAKRWAARLLREGLPRAARLTGPRVPR